MWVVLKNGINKTFDFGNNKLIVDFKKLNVFIGANNSGKSYLLRTLLSRADFFNDYRFISSGLKSFFEKETLLGTFKFELVNPDSICFSSEEIELLNNYNEIKKKISQNINPNEVVGRPFIAEKLLIESTYVDYKKTEKEVNLIINIFKNRLKIRDEELPKNYEKAKDFVHTVLPLFERKFAEYVKTTLKEEVIKDIEENKNIEKCFAVFEYNPKYETYISDPSVMRYWLFIPPIRSLRHPLKNSATSFDYKEEENDIFKSRIIKEYDIDTARVNIFTGLDFYYKYKTKLLGNKEDRQKIQEFEKKVSEIFFNSKPLVLIPNEERHEITISIDGDEDKNIYNVGDGISHIIMILFALIVEHEQYVFIEEPELGLHPGYQKILAKILSDDKHFANKTIFITTHSNHIIDRNIGFDDNKQIFKVSKTSDTKFEVKAINNNDVSILHDLGATPSSVFLANKAILVEGKYDALYMRTLLESESFNKKEGLDYVFIPYGGSNRVLFEHNDQTHEIEKLKENILNVRNITKDYLFIMDDDNLKYVKTNKSKKVQFHFEMEEKLKDNYYKLEVCEIENIVTKEVMINYIVRKLKNESLKELLEEEIDEEEYDDKKLSDYLKELSEKNEELKDLITVIDKNAMYKEFLKQFEKDGKISTSAKVLRKVIVDFLNKE